MPTKFAVILRFSDGLTQIIEGATMEDILGQFRAMLDKKPKRTLLEIECDPLFNAPRVRKGNA